ncbi:uncharacterized protein [Spinacia oleracea]|uniref:Replication factor A C-terminal domain-containing protein n=1 Tax=Spinacia oleracea TaxID=3562 RepID=A0A9R0JFL1_SPIOL|nr:uncharacterized protein LOC110805312 [Spinacia oleracea]XP_056686984.1 uncharacterized protein LOC130462547 [Spinacia oleracea]XP_056696153.1 uncharacterized protein LOC110804356 [Spinacia oleracea]
MYQGNYQLNSTNATQIHINLPIPEIEGFKQGPEPRTPIKQLEAKPHETLEQAMFKNRKKIQDILQMDPQTKDMFTISATIMSIHLDKKWHYNSCDACKKKIDETFYCTNCEVVVKYPKTRYLLTVDIDDGTACIPMALFDKEAEIVVGSPIHKLLELQKNDNGKDNVLDRLQHCVGKQFAFKVKQSTRSETTELICQKTFHIDYQLEKSYKELQGAEVEQNVAKKQLMDKASDTIQVETSLLDNATGSKPEVESDLLEKRLLLDKASDTTTGVETPLLDNATGTNTEVARHLLDNASKKDTRVERTARKRNRNEMETDKETTTTVNREN